MAAIVPPKTIITTEMLMKLCTSPPVQMAAAIKGTPETISTKDARSKDQHLRGKLSRSQFTILALLVQ